MVRLLFALFLGISTAFASQAIDLGIPSAPNDLCARAHLTAVEFRSVTTVDTNSNYCAIPVEKLPNDVRGAIEKIGELNEKIADALGISAVELFGDGHRVVFDGFKGGSISSESDVRGVTLTVLPDWTLEDFPSSVYAHEVIHVLAFGRGPLAKLESGIQDHPLIFEAFPDLVSAVTNDIPGVRLGESKLNPLLRDYRNAAPPRSFDEKFRVFYRFGNVDSLVDRCRKLDLKKEAAIGSFICGKAENGLKTGPTDWQAILDSRGGAALPFTEENLEKPFTAERCLSRSRSGFARLDNCDNHQFAFPLVSLFFRLKELTGKHQLRAFVSALRKIEEKAPTQDCRYEKGTKALGGKHFEVRVRSILGAFLEFRESLADGEKAAFDRAWNESGFAKFVDLDRLYRLELFSIQAQIAAAENNPLFAKNYGCLKESLDRLDPVRCRVVCAPQNR